MNAAIDVCGWGEAKLDELYDWLGELGYKPLFDRVYDATTVVVHSNLPHFCIYTTMHSVDVQYMDVKFWGHKSFERFKAEFPKYIDSGVPVNVEEYKPKDYTKYKLYSDDASHKYLIPVPEYRYVVSFLKQAYNDENWDAYEDLLSNYKLLDGQDFTITLD